MENNFEKSTGFKEQYSGKEKLKEGVEVPNYKKKEDLIIRESVEKNIVFLKRILDKEEYEKLIAIRVEEAKEKLKELEEKSKELEDVTEDLEYANYLAEDKIEENREAKFDKMTNLKIRSYFFTETIPRELSKALGTDVERFTNEDWLELLQDEANDWNGIDLSVVLADVSYLNLANRDGHASGDNLIKKIGKFIIQDQEMKKNTHRYAGGDEFVSIFRESGEAEFKMKHLQENFSKAEGVSNLANYDLKPNLDFGKASFFEAVEIFRVLLKTDIGRERIEKDNVFKEFNTIWSMLADKRAGINKAKTRIPLLMERYEKGFNLDSGEVINQEAADHYNFLTGYLIKGANEISKGKIAELIKASGGDENKRDELIWDFIQESEREKLSDSQEYSVLKDRVIAQKAGIIDEI